MMFTIFLFLLLVLTSSAMASHCTGQETVGCTWQSEDWTPPNGMEISGIHTGVRTFTVTTGTTVTIKAWDGSQYGSVDISAVSVVISGTLHADGKGFGGGGGGGGAAGGGCSDHNAVGGNGGAGVAGGSAGVTPPDAYFTCGGGVGGAGGGGGGPYSGSGGTAATSGGNGADGSGGAGGVGGNKGGYRRVCSPTCVDNGDTSTNEVVDKGSGGAGGGGGGGGGGSESVHGHGGGGGGGGAGYRGGGSIILRSTGSIIIAGTVRSTDTSAGDGASSLGETPPYTGGGGGVASSSGSSLAGAGGLGGFASGTGGSGKVGGRGAGGGILLRHTGPGPIVLTGTIDDRGGGNDTTNGGTVKIFAIPGRLPTYVCNTSKIFSGRCYNSETLTRGYLID